MNFTGKVSTFGGAGDKGMGPRPGVPEGDTGLAFYEPAEANERPDIFTPAPDSEPLQATWKRLRPDFPYIALNVDRTRSRVEWRNTPWRITNPKTGKWVIGFLVDRGPGAPGRVCDVSYSIEDHLGLKTDDVVEVESI